LRGKPVAVGGESGIIASASYGAPIFCIYTPMPTVQAHGLSGWSCCLGDFDKYERFHA
jgi:nucleotidyltransferase/DNA polymerase involved in DNA repair